MDHVAILSPKFKYVERILDGTKSIESRWYKTKRAPWNKIKIGDSVYFKDSGRKIEAKATVEDIKQYTFSSDQKLPFKDLPQSNQLSVENIYTRYGNRIMPEISENKFKKLAYNKIKNGTKYCILVFLKDPIKVKPFKIDKKGFGTGAAWICVEDIKPIVINQSKQTSR